MKQKFLYFSLISLFVTTLCSCEKEEFTDYDNSYTYKLSGNVVLVDTKYYNATPEEREQWAAAGIVYDSVQYALKPEQGQLRVIDQKNGNAFITFNDMTGGVTVANATVTGKEFSFDGIEKTVVLANDEDVKWDDELDKFDSESGKVSTGYVAYTGSGKIYGETLIFNLDYQGSFKVKNINKETDMTIVKSNIQCVANKNK